MLKALLKGTHYTVDAVDLGSVADTGVAIDQVMRQAIQKCDLIVTTGGVSMGELDLIKPYIEQRGEVFFGRLNMKPGKPTTFGVVRDETSQRESLIFGLPGNPVSCYVTATLFLDLALKTLAGSHPDLLPHTEVTLLP